MIDHNITPRIGSVRLTALRPADLDACYRNLIDNGGHRKQGFSAKTVLEIHRVISNALDLAVDRELIDTNPARRARPPRGATRSTVPAIWTAAQLPEFLEVTKTKRLYPALHLVAHTGIRRGELAGLNWADLDTESAHLSIVRARQVAAGRTVEAPVKTRTSRRRIDLVATVRVLWRWAPTPQPHRSSSTDTTAHHHQSRSLSSSPAQSPRHSCRESGFTIMPTSHASLLEAAGVPIEVVSERLGHAHPGFTMHTYQHLLPGMGAEAANRFAQLITDGR